MARDKAQFELSRYLDGDLSDAQRAAVEARLASDPEARKALADFRRVDELAAAAAPPMEAVRWGRFRLHVLDRLPQRAARRPGRVIRLAVWSASCLAAAAAVLMAVVSFMDLNTQRTGPGHPGMTLALAAPQKVTGITIEMDTIQPVGEPVNVIPAPAGTILIDVPTLEPGAAAHAAPAHQPEGGVVIAMAPPADGDVVTNAGPEAAEWDSVMTEPSF